MKFEWDEKKNRENIKKHQLSFERAVKIFEGPILNRSDRRSYGGEEREISMGMIEGERIIVVVHVMRGDKIRIISARKATAKERKIYYERCYKKT